LKGWLRTLAWTALAALALLLCVRLTSVETRRPELHILTLPAATPTRWVNSIVPERTGALVAARMLARSDGGDDLVQVLRDSYARMDAVLGSVPTPAVATYLGLQSSRAFDTIFVEPRASSSPKSALVFLHGFAGNFDIYCWQAARATPPDMLVACPSLGPRADWWTRRGHETLRVTLQHLRARGVERVYLAGLSNGAAGVGVLAPQFRRELRGIALISGAPPKVSPPPGLPVLVVQGQRDGMMPASLARSYFARTRAPTPRTYVALDGGHFVFLSRFREVTAALHAWLSEREALP
jgi:pimeloyl-ACP methyl ester carboxylesterase